MLRTAEKYIWEEMGVEMPKGEISGQWFAENDLPMVVQCTECGMRMALPSALIDDEGCCYCTGCVSEELIEW